MLQRKSGDPGRHGRRPPIVWLRTPFERKRSLSGPESGQDCVGKQRAEKFPAGDADLLALGQAPLWGVHGVDLNLWRQAGLKGGPASQS